MMIRINHKRAKTVVLRVYKSFRDHEGLLAETEDLVENQIPEGVKPLSREHALFLFYTVVNDHGVKSSHLYRKAKLLFLEKRDIFEPFRVINNFEGPDDPRLVEATGKRLGTRYPKETAKTWYVNSEKLIAKYDGDPRKLFSCCSEAKDLLREIMTFRGYGPKIGGMLLRAIIGLGFAKVKGVEKVLVPVDIHDSRIAFLTGILEIEGKDPLEIDYYAHIHKVQRILRDACNHAGIQWLDVDRALWIIGSRGCVRKRCYLCPLKDICVVGKTLMSKNLQQLDL